MKLRLVASFADTFSEKDLKLVSELLKLFKKHGYTTIEIPFEITAKISKTKLDGVPAK